jgi:hypothetical protein
VHHLLSRPVLAHHLTGRDRERQDTFPTSASDNTTVLPNIAPIRLCRSVKTFRNPV